MQRTGRGVLLIVAAFLAGSALVRFGGAGGIAIASTALDDPVPPSRPMAEPDVTPELLALLADVRLREAALQERTASLEARIQVLRRAETDIADGLRQLEEAEPKLRSTIADANTAAESDIVRLTAVYENMKADQAAQLFSRMEPSFAAGFLGRMRADAAAAILAGLEPDLAYSISVVLAGRNADIAVEPLPQ